MVSRAGLEPARPIELPQVIDSTIRQKRQNRYFSRTEVHGGYTGYEFVNCLCEESAHAILDLFSLFSQGEPILRAAVCAKLKKGAGCHNK